MASALHSSALAWGPQLGYAAVLECDQIRAGRAVYNFDEMFRVSALEITSGGICRLRLVPESPDHAIDYDVKAFISEHWAALEGPMTAYGHEIKPLMVCPHCRLEMRVLGIETDGDAREVYTFECVTCGYLEARGVLVVMLSS